MESTDGGVSATQKLERLVGRLDQSIARLEQTRAFAKSTARGPVIDIARRVMLLPGGVDALYARAGAMEAAGIFTDTDWGRPEILQPSLTANTLRLGDTATAMLECLSEIRLLAVANRDYIHPNISSEQARHFVSQTLALNLDLLFQRGGEVEREVTQSRGLPVQQLYAFILEHIGYENILDSLIEEIERILAQRPITVEDIKTMITQISVTLADPAIDTGGAGRGADRLISALFGPTSASRDDPGFPAYQDRLSGMDAHALGQEAGAFARAMHDTGLVSPYHAVCLRHILEHHPDLVLTALGLSSTGRDALLCYQQLVHGLIAEAIHPETAQAVYGLALLLERGILYMPAVGPALWRQMGLALHADVKAALAAAFGPARPPRVLLLAGVLSVLGQPLGLGQGNNPTCQAARAMSMWAYTDPDYLLQMVAWAGRDNELVMHFEGHRLSSNDLPGGLMRGALVDVDAVSVVLVPHLDRIYMEMGRLCAQRGGDPHQWINPELHGWWVGRGCRIAIDVASGRLHDYANFLRQFYATYHPYYNGNQPVIHPQPAGIAITDSAERFIGWHAISIYRIGLDPTGCMRAYFYNPNNDGGQDWGHDVVVSTEGSGERFGESSLPIEQFASRLYLFHFDPLEHGVPGDVPADEIDRIAALARSSWAKDR